MNLKLKKTIFTATLFIQLFGINTFAQDAKIIGRVYDGSNGSVLPDAVIRIEPINKGAASDLDGNYSLVNIKPGEYTLKASYVGYNSQTIKASIKGAEVINADFILQPEFVSVDTLTIEADRLENNDAALLMKQQKSDKITDGISAQQIKRTPDALASDVLKRVIGVNIVNDKFVYVRGTSERYNNTTLNGVQLPSTEPDKKAFSFDIFPSALLDNIVISKSFTADQPGNYSGGLVQLQTKDFPEKFSISFQSSMGYNTETSMAHGFIKYNAGQSQWLFFNSGLDDGGRSLPSGFPDTRFSGINNYGSLFKNNWNQENVKAPLNGGFNLSVGGRFDVFKNPLGYIFGYSYKNSFNNKIIERNEYNGDTTQIIKFNGQSSEYSVNNGSILNLSYRIGESNKISFKNTYSISSEDETEYLEGWRIRVFTNGDEDRKLYRTSFTERKLFSSMLTGSHFVKALRNLNISWKAAYSESYRNEPDLKRAYYKKEFNSSDQYYIPIGVVPNANVGNRFFSNLFDKNRNFGLDFDFDFIKFRKKDPASKIKLGGLVLGTNRNFKVRSFDPFLAQGAYLNPYLSLDSVYSPLYVNSSIINYAEVTNVADSYNANENLYASYLSLDVPVSKLRIIAGVRFEYSEQKLQGFSRTSPLVPVPINVNLKTNDYLPAVNVTYSLSDRINLRASFSQTISRPEIRELAPFGFIDFITDGDLSGNPDLHSSLVQNYDLRIENYPNGGEILAFSLFYKHFDQPIEKVIVPTLTQSVPSYTFENAKQGAVNYGFEIEARKNLGFINKILKDFSLNVNFTMVASKVDLTGTFTAANTVERRMQGQAPFTINTGLYYDNFELGTSINLSFNRTGDKIAEVGRVGFEDVFEQGRNVLDFSASQKIFNNFELKFTAKDILNEDLIYKQNVKTFEGSNELVERIVRRYSTGINYTLSVGYKF